MRRLRVESHDDFDESIPIPDELVSKSTCALGTDVMMHMPCS